MRHFSIDLVRFLFLNSFARELELDWLSHGQPAESEYYNRKDSASIWHEVADGWERFCKLHPQTRRGRISADTLHKQERVCGLQLLLLHREQVHLLCLEGKTTFQSEEKFQKRACQRVTWGCTSGHFVFQCMGIFFPKWAFSFPLAPRKFYLLLQSSASWKHSSSSRESSPCSRSGSSSACTGPASRLCLCPNQSFACLGIVTVQLGGTGVIKCPNSYGWLEAIFLIKFVQKWDTFQ